MSDTRPDPESDAFIAFSYRTGGLSGSYSVSVDGCHIFTETSEQLAHRMLHSHLERLAYWPNVWAVNERGNTDLLVWNPDTREYDHAGTSYV